MEWFIVIAAVLVLILLTLAVKVVWQYQRGVVFRLGKYVGTRGPGFNLIWPIIDRLVKVDIRIVPLPVEPQEVITKDNVTMKVDAVVYFWVVNPESAVIRVLDYVRATHQIAQ